MLSLRFPTFRIYGLFWLLLAVAVYPGVGDGYTQAKYCVLLAFYCFISLRLKRLPAVPLRFFRASLGLGAAYILSIAINSPGPFGLASLEWLGFFLASSAILGELLANNDKPGLLQSMLPWIRGSLAVLLLYHFVQECGYQPIAGLWFNDFPASLFGFQNMTAEFYGLSLSAIWISLASKNIVDRSMLYDCLLLTIGLTGLITTISRTAYLSFALVVFCSLPLINKRKQSLLLISLSLLIAIPLGYGLLKLPNDLLSRFSAHEMAVIPNPNNQDNTAKPSLEPLDRVADRVIDSKSQTASTRLIRLKNSWFMLLDHPLGVGPGNYEFGYMPYRHKVAPDPEANAFLVPRSPHNAYLELAIENGIAALICLGVLLGTFFYAIVLRRQELTNLSLDHKWGLLLSVFLLVDALFAFPLEIPFPQYATVLAVALNISLWLKIDKRPKAAELRLPLALRWVAALLFAVTFAASMSLHAPGNPNQLKRLQVLSCRVFPEQWQSCLRLGYTALDRGDVEQAYDIASWSLRGRDNNFPAQLLLASAAYLLHRDEQLCLALKNYSQASGESMDVRRLIGQDRMGNSPVEDSSIDDPCR